MSRQLLRSAFTTADTQKVTRDPQLTCLELFILSLRVVQTRNTPSVRDGRTTAE